MNDQQTLEQLRETGPTWAAGRADIALALWEQYQGGGVDEFDFQDNMRRLVSDEELDGYDDLETRHTLVTAVLGLSGEI